MTAETTEHQHTTQTPPKQGQVWLKDKIIILQIKVISRRIITLRHQMKKYFQVIILVQINIPQIKIIINISIKITIAELIKKIN